MTLHVSSPVLGGWFPMNPPSTERPYWHHADDGTRHCLHDVQTDPAMREQALTAHIDAVSQLLRAIAALHPVRDFRERRRLAAAASALCAEVDRPRSKCEWDPAP